MRTGATTAALLTVLATATATPSDASPAPDRLRMWRVTRTGSGPARLSLSFGLRPTSPQWLRLVVSMNGAGRGRTARITNYADAGEVQPTVYSGGTLVRPGCAVPTFCAEQSGSVTTEMTVPPTTAEYLLVSQDGEPSVTLRSSGWRVREVAPTTLRRVTADAAGATGGSAAYTTVEQYEGSSAPGGRWGSVALARLPCDNAGHGSATLAPVVAGRAGPAVGLSCSDEPNATSATSAAATWEVVGSCIGATYAGSRTRLLVLDLPRT